MRVMARNLSGGGIPLLILNGLGQSIEILVPLMQELGDRPVVVFDMPGVGLSQMSEEPLGIPQYAQVAQGVLDELEVGSFDVLGISWGGGIAQQLAYDFPDRCRRLILAVTSAGGLVSWWGSPIALGEIMFPLRFTSRAYGNLVGPLMYGGDAVTNPKLFREYSKHARHPTPAGYFSQVRALCSWTSVHWLHQIEQPTLVIAGTCDTLIPFPNQLLLAQSIPGAEMRVFAAGHLLLFSRRQEVGELITRFLEQTPASPTYRSRGKAAASP
ncbi:MAG: alpha/beta fold hydrolase [Thiohalobacteraceae bacterium]|uniref:alpha/beta fold hydrolase n=1 Tax=Sulfitobacter sp. MOLA879 TaxID=3368579 RepID=UPI0035792BF7